MWWLLVHAAFAGTTAQSLDAAWEADKSSIKEDGPIPLALSPKDFDALAKGDPVAHRVDTAAGAFASGAIWAEAPLPYAWIAIQDARDRPLGHEVIHEEIPGGTPAHHDIYMRIPLPWPISDRQWVGEFADNQKLFEATAGKIWQRRWTLADRSLAPHPDPDAIWVPASNGAWTLFRVDDGTLCIFSIHNELGGAIPNWISNTLAIATVKKGLRALVANATDMATHYRGDHEVMVTPDGTPIPLAP